jgi:hypothetical protein
MDQLVVAVYMNGLNEQKTAAYPTAIFRGRTIPACPKPELTGIFNLTGTEKRR